MTVYLKRAKLVVRALTIPNGISYEHSNSDLRVLCSQRENHWFLFAEIHVFLKIFFTLLYFMLYVCTCTHHGMQAQSRGQLVGVNYFLFLVGSRYQTEAIRLGNKCLYP